jgi:hypothetical protein
MRITHITNAITDIVVDTMTTILSMFILALLFALTNPALASAVRCTTYEEQTLNRLQTICDDGTRAVSTYNRVLGRWDTTITDNPRQACTAKVNPVTKAVDLKCR